MLRISLCARTSGEDGRLVAEVGQVGAGQPRGLSSETREVDVRGKRLAARVDVKDRLAAGEVGLADEDLSVEATWAKQSGIEVLEPVRGGDNDDLLAVVEAVKLDEELVQRLVVLAVEAGAATARSDSVELVDEDDRRRVSAGALEELADARSAKTGEHLHEGRSALRVERRPGGMGDRLREQRLAGAGRAVEQDALRHAGAKLREALGIPEEVDDFLQLGRGVVDARDVVPGHRRLRGGLDLGRPHPRHERERLPDQVHDQPEEDQGQPCEGDPRKIVDEVREPVHPALPSAGRGKS